MPLAVRERERAPPRASGHEPSLDAEVLAQPFDVRDQVRRGVVRQVDDRFARVRRAPAAVPLVEQDDPVRIRVEQPRLPQRAARARTAVQHDRGPAEWVPARLPVQEVALAHIEHAVLVRLDLGVRAANCPAHASTMTDRPA